MMILEMEKLDGYAHQLKLQWLEKMVVQLIPVFPVKSSSRDPK